METWTFPRPHNQLYRRVRVQIVGYTQCLEHSLILVHLGAAFGLILLVYLALLAHSQGCSHSPSAPGGLENAVTRLLAKRSSSFLPLHPQTADLGHCLFFSSKNGNFGKLPWQKSLSQLFPSSPSIDIAGSSNGTELKKKILLAKVSQMECWLKRARMCTKMEENPQPEITNIDDTVRVLFLCRALF